VAANDAVVRGVTNCHAAKLMQTAQEQGMGVNYFEVFLYLHLHYGLSLKRYANLGVLMPTAEMSWRARRCAGVGKMSGFVPCGCAGSPASIAARLGHRGRDV